MKDLKISKELWLEIIKPDLKSNVLKDGIIENFELESNILRVSIFNESNSIKCKGTGLHTPYNINIYEFAFKCKEWILNKGYSQLSGKDDIYEKGMGFVCSIGSTTLLIEDFYADTEIEAIIKACEWILKYEQLCNN